MEELAPERLRRRCDPATLGFATTEEVPPLEGTIGQPRAVEALEFGLEIGAAGFNVLATGPIGTGKRSMLERHLGERAAGEPSPNDLVCMFSFGTPERPLMVELPTGSAREFARAASHLIEEARRHIGTAFESESYSERRERIENQLKRRVEQVLSELREYAQQHDLAIELTPAGLLTLPLLEGKPVPPQQFETLPPERQQAFREQLQEVESRAPTVMRKLRELEREGQQQFEALDREVAHFAAGHLVEELKQRWSQPKVKAWLDAALEDMIENLPRLRSAAVPEGALPQPMSESSRRSRELFLGRYVVNVLVTHSPEGGAPVVFAPNATFHDLFGRIEYESSFGAVTTDHRLIRAGAVHRANGGYLVLEAQNVLGEPFVWRHLKEALRTRQLRIQNVGAQYTLFPTATLDPEPAELDLKVVLVAPPVLQRLLYEMDEDARKLFKVRADFDVQMPWTDEGEQQYAAFISRQVREDGLRHFDSAAVARVIEEAARGIEQSARLSARFSEVANLVAEASHWAAKASSEQVHAEHVETAVERRTHRSNLLEERIRELIAEGTLLVDVEGSTVGQLNAVAVARVGEYEFGHPTRVTATVSAGGGELLNIDRESKLSGPIHDKGFLILAGFLRDRYAREVPLSLNASLVFEQSYDQMEGDSAATAELLALLSALADLPLRQDVAITGSVNQHGQIQPVGAVNAKVEGFYEVCRQHGLTGEQGVLIPATNVRHLMLKPAVVDAVRAGRFHVFAVATIEEALALLAGRDAGERGPDGSFPPDSVNRLIDDRLRGMAEAARRFLGGSGPDGAAAEPAHTSSTTLARQPSSTGSNSSR